jgi:hypothetical protein
MATCMDVPVEKEIAATTTGGRPISASNKKRASNKKMTSNKKNYIDTTGSFDSASIYYRFQDWYQ